jgi:hypothetical protein
VFIDGLLECSDDNAFESPNILRSGYSNPKDRVQELEDENGTLADQLQAVADIVAGEDEDDDSDDTGSDTDEGDEEGE